MVRAWAYQVGFVAALLGGAAALSAAEPSAPPSAVAAATNQTATADDPQWAFRPIVDPPLPSVAAAAWPGSAVDQFLLARLETQGLSPAEPAKRAALLRRATFDLIGLPPTPDETLDFLADDAPEAFAKRVDRLLASPRYGERWARHWLDAVRYADTDGHEFDPDKPHAWRYRDYVIEALNADVPYDQFVREHLAGDLLPTPRMSADGRSAASPLGTTFWWLGEVQGVPVDPAMAAANLREQQLDAFGRGLLGLTIACARCHEHKFDPISSADYYALCGFLESTQPVQAALETAAQRSHEAARLAQLRQTQTALEAQLAPARIRYARERLPAVRQALLDTAAITDLEVCRRESPGLYPWAAAVIGAENSPQHPLYGWARLRGYSAAEGQFAKRRQALAQRFRQAQERTPAAPLEVFADFETETWPGWTIIGPAFAVSWPHEAERRQAEGLGCASSGAADRLTGKLLSPEFTIEKRFLAYLIAGPDRPQKTCVNLLINGQALPLRQRTGAGDVLAWTTVDVADMRGRTARLEVVDDDATPGGFVAIDHVCFCDEEPAAPQASRGGPALLLLGDDTLQQPADLSTALTELFDKALSDANDTQADDAPLAALRRWLLYSSPLSGEFTRQEAALVEDRTAFEELRRREQALLADWPTAALGLVAADRETGHDAAFQSRGLADAGHVGPPQPRRFLSALSGEKPLVIAAGSGRLELAAAVTSPQNPLLPRAIVNRVWQHHFGRGLVATSDNFGEMGERPTHPELLDHLATRLIESGWSLKSLHRGLLLSSAYQQSSAGAPESRQRDPDNRLLARMSPRRLEAECLRDAMLQLGDRLDGAVGGPSVPMYIEPWMHGRDLPKTRGPLDGAGRRSLYLEVRRNFAAPLLSAFDFPQPQASVGRRQTSLAPVQGLALMNDEQVRRAAEAWAARLLTTEASSRQRIERMYMEGLARRPTAAEVAALERFIDQQGSGRRGLAQAWSRVCLALLNLDEFATAP